MTKGTREGKEGGLTEQSHHTGQVALDPHLAWMECPVESVWVVVPVRERRGSWFSRLSINVTSFAFCMCACFPRRPELQRKSRGQHIFDFEFMGPKRSSFWGCGCVF